jgi:uncharacterized linocin/CFP29 family protein
MSPQFSMSRVGADTAQLLDSDLQYIETQVTEAVHQKLIARNLFAPVRLPDIGIKEWTSYDLSDMSQARIDMDGLNKSFDRTKKTAKTVFVPMIHKEYKLLFRDIAASRRSGMPIDVTEPQNAAVQVAEEEDKLLLTGEYTGWRALGIEGLATATGRNTEASDGAWSTATNIIKDVSDAIAELEADGHNGPYDMVVRSTLSADLRLLIANTGITAREKLLGPGFIREIFVSDNLYASNGATTSALVVEPGPMNFVVGIEQEVSVNNFIDEDMNTKGKVWEILTPKIRRPTSICEITGISA